MLVFTINEPMTEGGFPHCLHGGADAREEFEVKDDGEAVAAHSSQLADCVNLSAMAVRFAHP
jgi:hypothetical protein